jgi:hypothetical protein
VDDNAVEDGRCKFVGCISDEALAAAIETK